MIPITWTKVFQNMRNVNGMLNKVADSFSTEMGIYRIYSLRLYQSNSEILMCTVHRFIFSHLYIEILL